ncbi:MAG: rod shape-determining protein MreD, partial [Elusimicrobiota bacterium]|nr:rod shape-determining protein MreD [Elusimicrobiota bacterium]
MKKFIFYLTFYAVFTTVQFFVGQRINIFSVFPNFILIGVVYTAMMRGKMEAQVLGFFFGLTWDVFAADVFGSRTVMFTIIGYFIGSLKKSFDIDQVFTQIFVIFSASLVYWAGFNLISYSFAVNSGSLSLFAVSL